jgi:IS66 Orf2 like protein
MLSSLLVRRILVALWRVDFRKGHLGLLGECRVAGIEPWNGDCVVFVSRCRTRIKVLFADETGLWVSYKQFAKGAIATQVEMLTRPETKSMSQSDFAMLLEGNSYTVTRRKVAWRPRRLDSQSVS